MCRREGWGSLVVDGDGVEKRESLSELTWLGLILGGG